MAYNAVVGTAGVATLAAVGWAAVVPPTLPHVIPTWQLVVLYGASANAAYTLGFVIECVIRSWWDDAPDVAPLLFREGVFPSIGVTLLPGLAVTGAWVVKSVGVLVHLFTR